MKVAHINTARTWSGGEVQTFRLIEGLQKRSIQNCLITQPGSPLAEKVKDLGAEVLEISMKGEWDIPAMWRISRQLKVLSPDVIHAHTSHAHTIGLAAGKMAGLKHILVTRRMDFPIKGPFSRLKYNAVSKVAAISEAARQAMLSGGVRENKITLIYSSVLIPEAIPAGTLRQELGIASDNVVLSTIAWLVERKGHQYILESLKEILNSFPHTKLIIVGDGPIRNDLEKCAVDLGVQDAVFFTGYRNDVSNILASTDIFVSAALMEGLGVSVLEAAAHNLPIVAARAGGIPEIVKDHQTGLLANPGDSTDLADKILYMMRNKDKARQMGHAARQWISERFSVEKMVDDYFILYHELTEAYDS